MGEIVFRGNIVMKEYFKDPEATRKAFRGGYFNSGDLAVWHPDGYIAIMDRSKDIIISGGENASSLAIEQGEHSPARRALDVDGRRNIDVWPCRTCDTS